MKALMGCAAIFIYLFLVACIVGGFWYMIFRIAKAVFGL